MRVLLHIGTHKTGTTSIQYAMDAATEDLAAEGILYPRSGKRWTGHHLLPWSLRGKHGITSLASWKQVVREIEEWQGSTVVISSEDFHPCTTDQIREIKSYLAPWEVGVILYVRHPVRYLISSYKQSTRGGTNTQPLDQFVRSHIAQADYASVVERWSTLTGDIDIRVFDYVVANSSLERDFAATIGADPSILVRHASPPRNTSPSAGAIEAARLVNVVEHGLKQLTSNSRLLRLLTKCGDAARGAILRSRLLSCISTSLSLSEPTSAWMKAQMEECHARFLEGHVSETRHEYLTW